MAKKNIHTPTETARVSVLYVMPTFLAFTNCPHCSDNQFVEIGEDENKRSLLHSCTACGKDYYIYIPDFKS
jgi:transcription elongation factor Elf1